MEQTLPGFDRITVDPAKLGGKPCLRGYRFSVEHLLELLAADRTVDEIQADFPFIEPEDVRQALKYAAALAHRELYRLEDLVDLWNDLVLPSYVCTAWTDWLQCCGIAASRSAGSLERPAERDAYLRSSTL